MIMDLIAGFTSAFSDRLPKSFQLEVMPEVFENIRVQLFKEVEDLAGSQSPAQLQEKTKILSIFLNGITVHITSK